MGTSSNGPESSIKIELGSKEAESYYNRKDNSINNDYCQQKTQLCYLNMLSSAIYVNYYSLPTYVSTHLPTNLPPLESNCPLSNHRGRASQLHDTKLSLMTTTDREV